MSEDDNEDFFVNTEGYPIDKILWVLYTNIVDNHLKDLNLNMNILNKS
jgi:hypothetical protein